jgi:NAD+ kinase
MNSDPIASLKTPMQSPSARPTAAHPPFKKVALVGRYQTEGVGSTIVAIATFLKNRGLAVMLEADTAESIKRDNFSSASIEEIGENADLAIAVGGDGTMLGIARELAKYDVPLIGINHGRLGFITDIAIDQWHEALGPMLDGQYEIDDRQLLTAKIYRQGHLIWQTLALNDIVVSRSSRNGMIELQVHVNGMYMYNQRADGLIIATPTGSTAYALSANGPILHPGLGGMVLVPVAPHSLSNRPICLPDHVEINVSVVDGREPRVSGDMQIFSELQTGDDIVVAKAPFSTRFLHPIGYSHFATLRSKLNWQEMPVLQSPIRQ